MSALKWGQKLEQESLHKYEIPLAHLSSLYANSKKLKPPYYSPDDFCVFKPREDGIPEIVCNAFLKLAKEGKIPSWAMSLAPVNELKRWATQTDIPNEIPLIWQTNGLALICPKLTPGGLKIGMALVDIDGGLHRVWDMQTHVDYRVYIPKVEAGAYFDVKWDIEEFQEDE